MKPYHAVIVFMLLVIPSGICSWIGYDSIKDEILCDMNQALSKTLAEQKSYEITPDTICNYRRHLQIARLRDSSFVYYAQENKQYNLKSKKLKLNTGTDTYEYQCYATCSFVSLLSMSDQRISFLLSILSIIWTIGSFIYFRKRDKTECFSLGFMVYSVSDEKFYNTKHEQVHLTPMQEQLLRMFFYAKYNRLAKQEICDALWPKKPDASETLYTLIKRVKPILEEQGGLQILSDRGKDYILSKKE